MHASGSSYIKRLRNRIFIPTPVDPLGIGAQISQSFDVHRQISVDSFYRFGRGPLAFFKNQSDTTPYVIKVMELSFGLQTHPALAALKQPQPQEVFPQERLLRFLSQQAPQV